MDELHELDAFVTWQGGFDYYFAHQDDKAVWQRTTALLEEKGIGAAARLMKDAEAVHRAYLAELTSDSDDKLYLSAIRALDVQWRQYVPALHKILASWRIERGLEEFNQLPR